ncbi:CDP-diacylglycerol--serine O-phosphatidyltransferase [Candidatus Woesearchaeota archaeon]|nr:CDP-diacylglycerol--serine O-phosphatidyltransferase [Candidatus Woesearchaeota archaeon]
MKKINLGVKGRGGSLTLMLLRIFLAMIVFLLIGYSKNDLALYLFAFTAFASFLDGFLAKKNRTKSQIRRIVDPFADKLLINLAAIALSFKGILPFWVMIAYLAKDLIMIGGALVVLIKNAKATFRTNAIDKVSAFIQIFTLFTVLMGRLDYVLIWASIAFAAASLIFAVFKSGIRVVSYKTELEEIRFRKLLRLPDLFTMMNILMGLGAILLSLNREYMLASLAFIFAVVFDYIDGKVARMIEREGDFGKQLDSLADTISFGVAPAIFGFSLIQTKMALAVFTLFLLAGVLRLARYNIMEFTGDFAGMPITVNGVVIPLAYVLGVPFAAYPYIYLFLAILMVSPLKIKKMG